MIYGATFQAVIAAIVLARGGRRVAIVAPETTLGGMITGGLGITDARYKRTWWGVTKEFTDAMSAVTGFTADRLRWNFAPSVAQAQVDTMIVAEAKISTYLGETLQSVTRTESLSTPGRDMSATSRRGDRLRSITTNAETYEADVFIDASYTGELMARAGVPHDVGTDPVSLYREEQAGVNFEHLTSYPGELIVDSDGDLTKFGQFKSIEREGAPDRKTMAGGFRHVITNIPGNSLGFPAPPGFNRDHFAAEIAYALAGSPTHFYDRKTGFFLRRASYDDAAAAIHLVDYLTLTRSRRETAWHQFVGAAACAAVPGKFLTNGSDIVGPLAWEYTTATDARRAEIRAALMYREMGRWHIYQNDPAIPQVTRDSYAGWGFCADEFTTHHGGVPGFPHEYYHRQGRRLRGQKVVTFGNVAYQTNWPDQIAHGGYFADSKAKEQFVRADGLMYRRGSYGDRELTTEDLKTIGFEDGFYFGVPMGAVVAPRGVCDNFAVAWSISASDVAFTAIRLEPFMAAIAEGIGHMALESLASGTPMAQLGYSAVRARLDAAGARLYRYIDGEEA